MAKKIIGIDIGNHSVKFAYREKGNVKCVSVPLPENMMSDGQITIISTLKDFLKKAKKENKIPSGKACVILSGRRLYCHMVNMPYIPEEQLLLNLPYEFRDYVANETEQFYYDYAVEDVINDPDGIPASVNILAACVSKTMINELYEAFEGTGFKMYCAIPPEFALSTILKSVPSSGEEKKSYCIADIGHTSTKVYFYQGSVLSATRNIEIGGRDIDMAISNVYNTDEYIANSYKVTNHNDVTESEACRNIYSRLAIEIMKSVNFFLFNNPDGQLNDIYLAGGTSSLSNVCEAIAETTNLEAHRLDELCSDKFTGDGIISSLVAYGGILGNEKKN